MIALHKGSMSRPERRKYKVHVFLIYYTCSHSFTSVADLNFSRDISLLVQSIMLIINRFIFCLGIFAFQAFALRVELSASSEMGKRWASTLSRMVLPVPPSLTSTAPWRVYSTKKFCQGPAEACAAKRSIQYHSPEDLQPSEKSEQISSDSEQE